MYFIFIYIISICVRIKDLFFKKRRTRNLFKTSKCRKIITIDNKLKILFLGKKLNILKK